MLNLSDKELDRFSREAAQEYEPGEVLGPQNWQRLEVRLDTEFGRSGWNFWRHVRRYPMYYAPALVVLLGVGYFLTRPGASSGSSPGKTAKAGTEKTTTAGIEKTNNNQNPTSTHSLNSTPDATTTVVPAAPDGAEAARTGNPAAGGAAAGSAATGGDGRPTSGGAELSGAAGSVGAGNEAASGAGKPAGAGVNAAGSGVKPAGSGRNGMRPLADAGVRPAGSNAGGAGGGNVNGGSGHRGKGRRGHNAAGGDAGDNSAGGDNNVNNPGNNNILAVNSGAAGSAADQQRELSVSSIQTAHSLGKRGRVSDSALRAFTLKSRPPMLKPTRHLEITRNWQFGLSIAPDFTSVNSLSSDRPGSSLGLTVDYMFAPHWYISSGILATRKNYAARNDNYAPPPNFYQRNNVMGDKINFAKGSFYMMEIPLNLRYDFSVSGNTLFFISGGASTYLLTSEDVNLYYQRFGFLWCQPVNHPSSKSTYLFSTINLSAGVETGLSNSLSLLVAPYVKLPTTKMGIGQVDMNSVGITFALKFSPVTGYKRK